jgi:hypothetical protein
VKPKFSYHAYSKAPAVGLLARSVLENICHPEEAESYAKRATPDEEPALTLPQQPMHFVATLSAADRRNIGKRTTSEAAESSRMFGCPWKSGSSEARKSFATRPDFSPVVQTPVQRTYSAASSVVRAKGSYQGTTSVVPLRATKDAGFSPCGQLSWAGIVPEANRHPNEGHMHFFEKPPRPPPVH